MSFERERAYYGSFKERAEKQERVLEQMEQAIETVYWTYDTAIWENRFIVGGTIEYIVGAALRACSIPVKHRGATRTDLDLIFDDGIGGYSIKSILKGTGTRLVNVMGVEPTVERWRSATLFLVPSFGIVYADPELDWWAKNLRRCVRPTKDALHVGVKSVAEFASVSPDWVVGCRLPREKDRSLRSHPARTASADVAAQILMHYSALIEQFAGLKPWEDAKGHRDQ